MGAKERKMTFQAVRTLTLLAILFLILGMIVPNSGRAADNRFPVGIPIFTQANICLDLESAKVMADNKGSLSHPDVAVLFKTDKCGGARGTATYVREVYRNGEWAVWELQSDGRSFYEATNWKGYVPGQVGA